MFSSWEPVVMELLVAIAQILADGLSTTTIRGGGELGAALVPAYVRFLEHKALPAAARLPKRPSLEHGGSSNGSIGNRHASDSAEGVDLTVDGGDAEEAGEEAAPGGSEAGGILPARARAKSIAADGVTCACDSSPIDLRGRCWLRSRLLARNLAKAVDEAVADADLLSQYYVADAAIRHPRTTLRLSSLLEVVARMQFLPNEPTPAALAHDPALLTLLRCTTNTSVLTPHAGKVALLGLGKLFGVKRGSRSNDSGNLEVTHVWCPAHCGVPSSHTRVAGAAGPSHVQLVPRSPQRSPIRRVPPALSSASSSSPTPSSRARSLSDDGSSSVTTPPRRMALTEAGSTPAPAPAAAPPSASTTSVASTTTSASSVRRQRTVSAEDMLIPLQEGGPASPGPVQAGSASGQQRVVGSADRALRRRRPVSARLPRRGVSFAQSHASGLRVRPHAAEQAPQHPR